MLVLYLLMLVSGVLSIILGALAVFMSAARFRDMAMIDYILITLNLAIFVYCAFKAKAIRRKRALAKTRGK